MSCQCSIPSRDPNFNNLAYEKKYRGVRDYCENSHNEGGQGWERGQRKRRRWSQKVAGIEDNGPTSVTDDNHPDVGLTT